MSSDTSEQFAQYLRKEIDATEEIAEVAQYGLEVLLSTLGGLFAVGLIGFIIGVLPEALVVVGAVALVRTFAGGAHCSSSIRCALVSGVIFPILGLIAKELAFFIIPIFNLFLIGVLSVCLLTVYSLAPVDSPEKPIVNEFYRRRLHRLSLIAVILVVGLIYIIFRVLPSNNDLTIAACFGLLWQSFVLTNTGHKLMVLIEKGFDGITFRRR